MPYNLADLFEHTADLIPDRVALMCGDDSRTFGELEVRSNRLAHHLAATGIEPDDHVGIYAANSLEWIEALLAIFKIRAVPININYRYVEAELAYLFDNADLKGLVYREEFGPRVAAVIDDLPQLTNLVMIPDGSGASQAGLDPVAYADALAAGSPERDFPERSGDDIVMIYTGGTTGMPKGVMWRAEDIFYALIGGTDFFTHEKVSDEWFHAHNAEASAGQLTFLSTPPLMHGAAFASCLMQLFQGNRNVLVEKFEAHDVWRVVSRHGVNSILIVGDAMGRPLIEALAEMEADGEALDLSSFISLSSSAAVFSPTVKDRFLERFPNLVLTDSTGATESRVHRHRYRVQGRHGHEGRRPDRVARTRHRGARRRPEPGRARLRGDRQAGAGRQHPHRVLQGRGQDRGHLPGGRRRPALLGARRLRQHRGRRTHHAARAEARCASTPAARRSSPKRSSRPSRPTPTCSMPSSWVRPTSGGASGSPPWSRCATATTSISTTSTVTPASAWPATSCPAWWSRWTRSTAHPAASPTTHGPSIWPPPKPPSKPPTPDPIHRSC